MGECSSVVFRRLEVGLRCFGRVLYFLVANRTAEFLTNQTRMSKKLPSPTESLFGVGSLRVKKAAKPVRSDWCDRVTIVGVWRGV